MKLISDNPDAVEPVVDLKSWREKAIERVGGRCTHRGKLWLDADTQTVRCDLCGEVVGNWFALNILCDGWSRQKAAIANAEHLIEELTKRVTDLKREERNTKARLRRAKRKEERENE